jgi:hypothetical protein
LFQVTLNVLAAEQQQNIFATRLGCGRWVMTWLEYNMDKMAGIDL